MTMTMFPDLGVLNVTVFTCCCTAAAVFSVRDKLKQKSKKTQAKDSMTTVEDKEKHAVALRKQQEERITKDFQYQETDIAEPLETLGVKIEINFLGPKKSRTHETKKSRKKSEKKQTAAAWREKNINM